MEKMISQRITPIIKCLVLFLFIFTAKVLTSRPQDVDSKNSIYNAKPNFVRTFTKYHHRRTIQWNNQDIWPQEQATIHKRSIYNDNEFNEQEISNNDVQASENKVEAKSVAYLLENHNFTSNLNIEGKTIKKVKDVDLDAVFNRVDRETIITKDLKSKTPFNKILQNSQLNLKLKSIKKRSSIPNSSEFINNNNEKRNHLSESLQNSFDDNKEKSPDTKSKVSNEVKKYKVKAAFIPTEAPTTMGPTIMCLYKTNNVAISATPAYDDERNQQLMVENDNFDNGRLSETTINGETVQVEQCTDSRAYCYTLWHQDNDGNVTVLGQGCWRGGRSGCDRCARVTPRLPATKFCCCTTELCNAHFESLQEEVIPMQAESTTDVGAQETNYSRATIPAVLALLAAICGAALLHHLYCRAAAKGDDVEKGDVMGSGPDGLATGLLCVDNLTLIEHIGQGKFGSVWRGSLGSTPVAVKLYSSATTWQKEVAIYAMPHIAHPNILRYYGSDTRATLMSGGREHLIVLELCARTLRARLERAPLSWTEFARLAHGLAAALAHLHTASSNKPCIVHRDVNSNNVLVGGDGRARLADLGLAHPLYHHQQHNSALTEAGTLRYLSPEALEGALDLSGARAALCAVDVYAMGLVLWELLWRTQGAHPGPVPPYALPYHHHGLPNRPTLAQMQSLVSRNKARPPLPKGPVLLARALKTATDTCDECWDHDAEARLTAVCVEERMSELKHMLQSQGPLIHDNNLHPHQPDSTNQPDTDKNSNCTAQHCDVTTPLLYPHPHIGRNACIERNTLATTGTTVQLIHKSLKDIPVTIDNHRTQNFEENCLSVARMNHRPQISENSDRFEVRSYQRPLEYVPNDVSNHEVERLERAPKQTNLLHDVRVEKPKWGIRKFFERLSRKGSETEVKLVPENSALRQGEKPTNFDRPSNLVLSQDRSFDYEAPCTLSPPNRTLSPTMMLESDLNRENNVFGFKELPSRDENDKHNQIFAVIVPKAKPADFALIEMRSKNSQSSDSFKNSVRTSMSSQSMFKSGESEDSTVKKRLSCDNRIISGSGSDRSSRASVNLELQYVDSPADNFNGQDSPFDLNSDCSSSEDEHLMLLSENGTKITMQAVPKSQESERKKYQNDVLKETSQTKTAFNKYQNKYTNFDNEFSDPNDKENLVNGYSGDNPVYLAALNGEIETDITGPKSPKPNLKNLNIKRQHSLEQVSEIFSSAGDVNLLNPAGRVKTPGDIPVAIRRARRDRALQKGRANECNRLSLYDDRMMFGNSL